MRNTRKTLRARKKLHIRKKVSGTSEKPRVFVFQSNKFCYVGLADDDKGKVIFSVKGSKKIESLTKLGTDFGKKMKTKKIEKAVFDRSGYRFGKRLTALVDGIRSSGISI